MSVADRIRKKINAAAKKAIASQGGKQSGADIPGYVWTGCFPLDVHLGQRRFRGGLPMGRIVEVFGRESAGKSTFATHVMIAAQRGQGTMVDWQRSADGLLLPVAKPDALAPGLAFLIDTEEGFYKDRAQRMGLDLDRLITLLDNTPEATIEDCFEAISTAVDTVRADAKLQNVPVVVVLDTIAALESRESVAGKSQPADRARAVAKALRKIKRKIRRQQVVMVVVNQTIADIGRRSFGGYASETTGAGRALKYYASLRVQMSHLGKLRVGDRPRGIEAKATVVKAKICEPWVGFELPIWFDRGIDDDLALAWFVRENGRLFGRKPPVRVQRGRYEIRTDGGSVEASPRKLRAALDAAPEVRAQLQAQVIAALADSATEESHDDPEEPEPDGD